VNSATRRKINKLLRKLRVYKTWVKYQTWRKDKIQEKYRHIHEFEAVINGSVVKFSTADDYSNRWFFPRYFGGKMHERSVTELLLKSLRQAECFADVGANLGWYTCLASKHMPAGQIYSFEMDTLNFDILRKNVALNNCQNVETILAAVSEKAGTARYLRYFDRPDPTFRLMTDKEASSQKATLISVPAITLDTFFQSRNIMPDVIKIDVEGAEMQVLKGMAGILREAKPVLYLEVHPWNFPVFNTSIEEILNLLTTEGYTIFDIPNMRSAKGRIVLRKIHPKTRLTRNTMLYATSAK